MSPSSSEWRFVFEVLTDHFVLADADGETYIEDICMLPEGVVRGDQVMEHRALVTEVGQRKRVVWYTKA